MKFQVGHVQVQLIERGDRICLGVLAKKKLFEPRSLDAWAQLCIDAEGGVVIDGGAYTGLYAIGAAMLGCKVYAFEPLPQNMKRLKENAELNGVPAAMLVPIEAALFDTGGTMQLRYNPKMPFTSAASLVREKPANSVGIEVKTRTIDSLDLRDLAAIKLDVERAEPQALAGAARTLFRCRPSLLVEVLGDPEKDAVEAALPNYRVTREVERNWLMVPR